MSYDECSNSELLHDIQDLEVEIEELQVSFDLFPKSSFRRAEKSWKAKSSNSRGK